MRLGPLPPKPLFGLVISLALVALLLGVTDFRALERAIFLPGVVVAELTGLMILYLVVKGYVWFQLVRRAGIDSHWRDVSFAYLGGELTKSLPGGIYFQNYLLQRLSGHKVAEGVATSTVVLGMEAAVTMVILLVLGVPGWPWLRPLMVGISALWVLLLLALWKSGLVGRLKPWAHERHPGIEAVLDQATYFYHGLLRIWHPRLWFELVLLSGAYILSACAQLFLIGQALHVRPSFAESCSAYAFSMILPLMVPIPVQIGFSELTGTGALTAMGLPRGAAIALMFAMRIWNNGLVYPLALPVMLAMPAELRRALGGTPGSPGRREGPPGRTGPRQHRPDRKGP